MLRRTPPLEALEIFVAAAQGDSFRSVARRLALNPSAISRRIAALEAFLGIVLFDRSGQSQRLNAAGRRYLSLVEPAIGAIQRASAMVGETDLRRLKVATSHSFAVAWLMPRLADFHRHHGIEVEVVPTRDFDALRSGEAQLGIWGGFDVPYDMVAETVLDTQVVPVAAPIMADGRPPPRDEEDLARRVLLTVKSPPRLWERWFAASGTTRHMIDVREFATLQLMYEAASSGLGVALAMPLVAEPYLVTGKLVPCVRPARSLGETYRLYRADRRVARSESEQRFALWLHKAVAVSTQRFEQTIAATSWG